MVNTLIKSTKKANEEGGLLAGFLVFVLIAGLIFGLLSGIIAIAMALWNGVLVALFPVISTISFWQMWGLYLLLDILIKPAIPSNND